MLRFKRIDIRKTRANMNIAGNQMFDIIYYISKCKQKKRRRRVIVIEPNKNAKSKIFATQYNFITLGKLKMCTKQIGRARKRKKLKTMQNM